MVRRRCTHHFDLLDVRVVAWLGYVFLQISKCTPQYAPGQAALTIAPRHKTLSRNAAA